MGAILDQLILEIHLDLQVFDELYDKCTNYMSSTPQRLYVFDGWVGASEKSARHVRFVAGTWSHSRKPSIACWNPHVSTTLQNLHGSTIL